MYVCVCNAKNDKDLKEARDNGCHTYMSVMKFWGVYPKCGKCKDAIRMPGLFNQLTPEQKDKIKNYEGPDSIATI